MIQNLSSNLTVLDYVELDSISGGGFWADFGATVFSVAVGAGVTALTGNPYAGFVATGLAYAYASPAISAS